MRNSAVTGMLAGLAGLAVPGAASAQDWTFNVSPYAWLAGLDGDVGALPGFPAQEVDLSFGDIWDDLDYAGFLIATARNGPWVIYLDTSIVQTTAKTNVNGPQVDRFEIETQTSFLALAAGRSVAQGPDYNVDLYAGARWWWVDNEFKIRTADGQTLKRSEDFDWVDPLIGMAVQYEVAPRWTLVGQGEFGGGLDGSSDYYWSLLGAAQYTVNDWFKLAVGYRYISVDYSDDGYVYDVDQQGPMLGATFTF